MPPPTAAYSLLDERLRKTLDDMTRPYVPSLVAAEFVGDQRTTDPDTFYRALDELAIYTIRHLINEIDRGTRARTARNGRFAAFRTAADAHAAGDSEALHRYLDERVTVDARGSRKLLGDCYRADLRFISGRHRGIQRIHGLRAALAEAMEREVGDGTVRDRYTDAELARLDASLAGG